MALVFLALPACSRPGGQIELPEVFPGGSGKDPAFTVAFLADEHDPRTPGLLRAAQLAAEEFSGKGPGGRGIRIRRQPLTGAGLAGLSDDPEVVGAITAGGAGSIQAAGRALDESQFAVFELLDDLYDAGLLRDSVFQSSAPHSWQGFRLARYFGPGDRRYRKAGFLREPGELSDSAARALKAAAALRGVELADAPGDVANGLRRLEAEKAESVVVEGSAEFRREASLALATAKLRYSGRHRIFDGWRPQPAFFESHLGAQAPAPGAVAAGDYAGYPQATPVEASARFRRAYKSRYEAEPLAGDVLAYDAVSILGEAVRRAGGIDRARLLEQLEGYDRVRFGHLPVSLGPDDHVVAERDVLGLWAADRASWRPLMRTFTSDLERTNILEEDWPAFFKETTPGGEAPFFHQAKTGITSDRDDLLN